MICFYGTPKSHVFAVETSLNFSPDTHEKLRWLFGDKEHLDVKNIAGTFMGPRRAMITPWSTNAVEITQKHGNQRNTTN